MGNAFQSGAAGEASLAVDVVVPCYNYGRFLRSAVESVLSQGVPCRVLIIDDCSSDDTEAVGRALAEADPRVTFVRHAANRGHIATYNEGIDWAESELFLILSADDLLMPGALRRAAAGMAAHPGMAMIHGRGLHFEQGLPEAAVLAGDVAVSDFLHQDAYAAVVPRGVPARHAQAGDETDLLVLDASAFFDLNRCANVVATCSAVTRTALQKRLDGYRPELPHAGDLEMWLRLAAHGTIGYVPRFQVAVRHHGINMSTRYDHARDLLQRIDVIVGLAARYPGRLPEQAFAAMRRLAAEEALGAMWQATVTGDDATAEALRLAAGRADPSIRRRPVWHAYRLRHHARRSIGPAAWNRIRAARDTLIARRVAAPLD